MALTSLVVCTDAETVQVLSRTLGELGISVQLAGTVSAATRLAMEVFDAALIDCKDEAAAIELITKLRNTDHNKAALAIALVDTHNDVRKIFATGTNFVIYKPVSAERANASLRTARGLMHREKRGNRRVRLHSPATIAYGNVDNASATLLDLSEDGVAMQAERKLPSRGKVYFEFSLPGKTPVVRLSGEVVWQDSGGRVGLRFADVPQASRRVLQDWLRANSTKDGEEVQPKAAELHSSAEFSFSQPTGFGLLSVSAADRRVKTRLACRIGADVYRLGTSIPYRCTLSDISIGGCYVETTEPFPAGTQVEIMVRTREMKLRVLGKVQSAHPSFGMGVEFTHKSADQRSQVEQLIAYQAANSEALS